VAFRTDQEALLLGALVAGPQHGYGIIKLLRDGSSGLFNMNEGQLYPLLHKMQEAGWIKGEWVTSDSGPAKKSYVLLEEGRKELGRRQAQWRRFSLAVGGLLFAEEDTTVKSQESLPGALEASHG
jgi:DNA-binding PadR family transcriptional regulator